MKQYTINITGWEYALEYHERLRYSGLPVVYKKQCSSWDIEQEMRELRKILAYVKTGRYLCIKKCRISTNKLILDIDNSQKIQTTFQL